MGMGTSIALLDQPPVINSKARQERNTSVGEEVHEQTGTDLRVR